MSEFVLKESSCGNHTLSILVDSDLIRVAKIDRIGASPAIKDILATRQWILTLVFLIKGWIG